MNEVKLKGIIKDIEPSHEIDLVKFDKAKLLCKRENGKEDVINLRFKHFSNKLEENSEVTIDGNIRSFSYSEDGNNHVMIYVFTYFNECEEAETNNIAKIDGRICKLNELRKTRAGKHNIHFIVANNLATKAGKRLNSYIPCIAWDDVADSIAKLSVNTKLEIIGEIHSREHTKINKDGITEIKVAHELLVKEFKVIE